jgi:hypothetical protein
MLQFSWVYNYLTYDRSTRAILTIAGEPITKRKSDPPEPEPLAATIEAELLAAKSVGAAQPR